MTKRASERARPAPAATTAPGPLLPRRDIWMDLPAEYGAAGFKVRVWANMPKRLLDDFRSGDLGRAIPATKAIILAHNGWRDEDGAEYPPADTDEFWAAIPDELARTLIQLVLDAPRQLPNSLRAMRLT